MPGENTRILVVEDNSLVMMMLEGVFDDNDWELVGPATSVDEALELAEAEALDAAILDINVNGQKCFPVAEKLRERDVPFLFATGYDRESVLPPELDGTPVVQKPYTVEMLETELEKLITD